MRAKRMTSKRAGTCRECRKPITPGQQIFWARGQGAWHVDCTTAGYQASQCTNCGGSGLLWNNAPCRQCDGTGARNVEEFARSDGLVTPDQSGVHPRQDHSGIEDRCCGDLAYEDDCARRCGY